jgi:tRNA(Arg) A34 adenosine deaminase TadA
MDDLTTALGAAFREADEGVRLGHGGPFGAAVLKGGVIIGRGHNPVLRDNDPTCHAEVQAIRAACARLGAPHLDGCVLVATSEPCPMCLTTSYWARVDRIVYATSAKVAAEAGFADVAIYEDLALPPDKRRLRVESLGLDATGRKMFAQWKKKGGKLY